eukprot:gnl/TRDRNA2_/TRDRNA2_172547_c0_seq4.p1 gnl/TRDRNA2_/TRDRNA2_172547_c0~~gnl/TRDRNA2_/TRDRNA2_172547_c0_seq4.p1  ORF type:complete len:501 (-),score=68.48 gnl/TRDRNA2_/TRDRNA2_172547_c0_seq4:96-1412(-)
MGKERAVDEASTAQKLEHLRTCSEEARVQKADSSEDVFILDGLLHLVALAEGDIVVSARKFNDTQKGKKLIMAAQAAGQAVRKTMDAANNAMIAKERTEALEFWASEAAKEAPPKHTESNSLSSRLCTSQEIPCQYAHQLSKIRKPRKYGGAELLPFCDIHDCDLTRQCLSLYADELNRIRPNLGENIRNHPLKASSTSTKAFIFCAGSGSTGSSSLAKALETLGLKAFHERSSSPFNTLAPSMNANKLIYSFHKKKGWEPRAYWDHEVQTCLHRLRTHDYTSYANKLPDNMKDLQALLDDPNFFLTLDFILSFPNAKVPFTTRPPNDWARARWAHVFEGVGGGGGDAPIPILEPCKASLEHNLYNFTKQDITYLYAMTNEVIRCIVPEEQLFEIDVFSMNSTVGLMSSLAKFLGVQLPANAEWPQVNMHGRRRRSKL